MKWLQSLIRLPSRVEQLKQYTPDEAAARHLEAERAKSLESLGDAWVLAKQMERPARYRRPSEILKLAMVKN